MMTEFVGNIVPVEAGQIFVIVGKTIDAASRLDLNLKSGKNEADNVILHLSVRFHENAIIRNARHNGEWGTEEKDDDLVDNEMNNPIVPGEIFKFYILIGDQQFHIAVNNKPYCRFNYRLPVEEARMIEVKYDLQTITQIDHRSIYPYPFPPIQYDDTRVVFSNDAPREYRSGHVIVIKGIPYGNPKGWFLLKFTEGASKKEGLHFNPRFDPYNVVVRNSMNEKYEYGQEERGGGFPFALDQQFKLAIALTETEFRFAVNGEYFTSFSYRTPNLLEKLIGFKVTVRYGMHIEINSVDHIQLDDENCDEFISYSSPDVEIF